jgi:hypothetical protein
MADHGYWDYRVVAVGPSEYEVGEVDFDDGQPWGAPTPSLRVDHSTRSPPTSKPCERP